MAGSGSASAMICMWDTARAAPDEKPGVPALDLLGVLTGKQGDRDDKAEERRQ